MHRALSEASGTLRRMNLVTAHDYAWIRTSPLFRHMVESGYTLTLIQGRTPREVLRAMEAVPRGTGEGTAGLIEADDAHRAEVDYDYWDESYVAGAFSARGENGDWTLVLGFDGGLGIAAPCVETLSKGGRVVAHSTNGGKPIHLFHWFEDGDLRTTFEGPSSRDGNTPDELVPLLREVGFPLTSEGEHDERRPGRRPEGGGPRSGRETHRHTRHRIPPPGRYVRAGTRPRTARRGVDQRGHRHHRCPRGACTGNGPTRRSRRRRTAYGRRQTRRS